MRTQLKSINIKRFRALEKIMIELGDTLTVICGKNGTSKSSILGIAAQVFSFEKNFKDNVELDHKTIGNESFTSKPSHHFRLSNTFDPPGSMDIEFTLYDAYTKSETTANLELISRGNRTRPQVRSNTSIAEIENTSRKFTHPVIFLSLKRLMPITARKYSETDYDYLKQNRDLFISLSNELLNKRSTHATATDGSLKSAAAHGSNYDYNSVSTGEDNAGQLILALMSFKKLKEELKDNYKGGLLLIDEADAGLFPAAQIDLIDMLIREAKALQLQVAITTHSPTIIEHVHALSTKYQRKYKTIYLTDTYGSIEARNDMTWIDIFADISTTTTAVLGEVFVPKINVYFEDLEAYDFFKALLYRQKINKHLNLMKNVTLSCTHYISLLQQKVPEFSSKSFIILDGDVSKAKKFPSVILLPSPLPPDQLVFQYLYNLPDSHDFWNNETRFTKPVFQRIGRDIINRLKIIDTPLDLRKMIDSQSGQNTQKPPLRELFKKFYNSPELSAPLKSRKLSSNIWHLWLSEHECEKTAFLAEFRKKYIQTLTAEWGVEQYKAELAWEG